MRAAVVLALVLAGCGATGGGGGDDTGDDDAAIDVFDPDVGDVAIEIDYETGEARSTAGSPTRRARRATT